jgi:hypothetical protein
MIPLKKEFLNSYSPGGWGTECPWWANAKIVDYCFTTEEVWQWSRCYPLTLTWAAYQHQKDLRILTHFAGLFILIIFRQI